MRGLLADELAIAGVKGWQRTVDYDYRRWTRRAIFEERLLKRRARRGWFGSLRNEANFLGSVGALAQRPCDLAEDDAC